METGTIACRIFILLSCGGGKSLKLDGQHNTGAPVTLALTALSNRMTHTPLSYTTPHQRTHTHTCTDHGGIESERKAISANVAGAGAVEVNGDEGPEYR